MALAIAFTESLLAMQQSSVPALPLGAAGNPNLSQLTWLLDS